MLLLQTTLTNDIIFQSIENGKRERERVTQTFCLHSNEDVINITHTQMVKKGFSA